MSDSWWQKYRPEEWNDIYGNNKSIKNIKKWANNFSEGDSALLFDGDAGTGKTSTAEVVANEMGWPIEEVNASDARKKGDIYSLVSRIKQKPTSSDFKLVLIDEADSLGKSSLKPLIDVLKNPPNPIIFTSNDSWKISDSITNKCDDFDFKINKNTKKSFIRDVCDEEEINLSAKEIGQLATRSDLRSIINDLQKYKTGMEIGWDDRDMETGEFQVVDNIINEKKFTGSVSPPDLVHWLDENWTGRVDGVELMRVKQALASSDKWLGHTNKTQDYSWWKYAGEIAEQTANLRISEPYDGYIRKSYPSIRRVKGSSKKAEGLFKQLKQTDRANFRISCDYQEFESVILPMIKSWSDEKKFKLVMNERLDEETYSTLGITKTKYENWLESAELGEFNAEEENKTEDSSSQGSIFDF